MKGFGLLFFLFLASPPTFNFIGMTSLTRTLASLRLFPPSASRPILRSVSIDATPPSSNIPSSPSPDPSSSSDYPIPTSSAPTTASTSSASEPSSGLVESLQLPYYHPVPRLSSFPSQFPNPPLHSHLNFPHPAYSAPPRGQMPDVLGGNMMARRELVLSSITGLSTSELRGLHRITASVKRVVNMSKKGKL